MTRGRLLPAWALCLAACGYAPVRSTAGHAVRTGPVKNDTAEAQAGGIFATALRGELAGRGRLDPEGASSPLLQLELIALQSVPTGAVTEGAVSFRLDAALKLTVGGWEDRFNASEDYIAGVDVLGTEANRRAALRRLARAAARDAVERYDVAERLK